jgi:hypothetical protein
MSTYEAITKATMTIDFHAGDGNLTARVLQEPMSISPVGDSGWQFSVVTDVTLGGTSVYIAESLRKAVDLAILLTEDYNSN